MLMFDRFEEKLFSEEIFLILKVVIFLVKRFMLIYRSLVPISRFQKELIPYNCIDFILNKERKQVLLLTTKLQKIRTLFSSVNNKWKSNNFICEMK